MKLTILFMIILKGLSTYYVQTPCPCQSDICFYAFLIIYPICLNFLTPLLIVSVYSYTFQGHSPPCVGVGDVSFEVTSCCAEELTLHASEGLLS